MLTEPLNPPGRATSQREDGRARLLFVASELPFPVRNGVTVKSANVLRFLARHYRVTLVSFVSPGDPPVAAGMAEARALCEAVHLLDAAPRRVGRALLRLAPPFVTRFATPDALALLARLAAETDFAVVHFDTVSTVPLLAGLGDARPLSVASINDSYTLMVEHRPAEHVLERAVWRITRALVARMERTWFPRFDQVHVVSEVDRGYLAALSPESRVHCVPNGVDTSHYLGFDEMEDPRTLVFFGELSSRHGHAGSILRFIRGVLPRIWERRPDVRLLVVGRNPAAELCEIASREPRIEVTGEVDDVRPYVARGAVSLSLNPLPGGIHNKVLESMALGRAVVGYARNFVSIVGAEAGVHFVAAETPEELSDAVLSLLDAPERRAALGAAARALVGSRYTWGAVEETYLSLVGAPSAGSVERRPGGGAP